MHHALGRATLLLACLAILLTAQAASAQLAPPTLTGEFLSSIPRATITSGTCDRDGTSSFTYEITGVAAGPYSGTFTETGSVTLGPHDDPIPGSPGQFRAFVLAFEAEFVITSPLGTVEGTKVQTAPRPEHVGVCLEPGSGDSWLAQVLVGSLEYEATIVTVDGTFRDRGESFANFNASTHPVDGGTQLEFREGYTSDLLTPLPGDGDGDPAAVELTPPTEINPVGSEHTVTATATTAAGGPAAGATILFTVEGASEEQGSCTTDVDGRCTFTWTGPDLPGVDLATACADLDASGTGDDGEPCGAATKIWVVPVTTPGQVTGGGWILEGGEQISFGFAAQSKSAGDEARGNCNVIDQASGTHVKCLTVDSLVVAGTHATLFGEATVDGQDTTYRIDVDDLGEPGSVDTFRIRTADGYVAAGTLAGGNVRIHN